MRKAEIKRKTAETDIILKLNLDGCGQAQIDTGCGFLNHMLTLFAVHGRFDLSVTCAVTRRLMIIITVVTSELRSDMAFKTALGEKRGICRYFHTVIPMDEALILTAADISGRGMLCFDMEIPSQKVGTFDTELVVNFSSPLRTIQGITLLLKSLTVKIRTI